MSNLILVMSLSGTLILGIYFILCYKMQKKFTVKWRYAILKLSIIFYLLPFPYYKYRAINLMNDINIPIATCKEGDTIDLINNFVIYEFEGSIGFSYWQKLSIIFYCVCISICILVTLYQLVKFIRFKKSIKIHCSLASESEIKIMEQLKNQIGIKRKITLLKSDCKNLALSTGIFTPLIILPKQLDINNEETKNVLKHELVHIKHKDTLWSVLAIVAAALHFFNPIVFLYLFKNLNKTSELYCDEDTVLEFDNSTKVNYCRTIIELSRGTDLTGFSNIYTSFSSNTASEIKERIDAIMNPKKKNKFLSISTTIAICVMALASGFTYKAPIISHEASKDNLEDILSGKVDSYTITVGEREIEPLYSDYYFIDENNQIYDLNAPTNRATCEHNYVSGVIKTHTKKSDGGCVIKFYDGKMCTSCHDTKDEVLIDIETHQKCPH